MHAWLGDTVLHVAVKRRKAAAMEALLVQVRVCEREAQGEA